MNQWNLKKSKDPPRLSALERIDTQKQNYNIIYMVPSAGHEY